MKGSVLFRILSLRLLAAALAFSITQIALPQRILLGDRDLQRGVLLFDATTGSLSRLGSCHGGGFYYGVAVHPTTGEI